MNAENVITAIQTLGFPVVVCIVMLWFIKYLYDTSREDRHKAAERHESELATITLALNNNTDALKAVDKTIAVLMAKEGKEVQQNAGN